MVGATTGRSHSFDFTLLDSTSQVALLSLRPDPGCTKIHVLRLCLSTTTIVNEIEAQEGCVDSLFGI